MTKIIFYKTGLTLGETREFKAEVQSEMDSEHTIYSLTYEGYRSAWVPA